MGTEPTVPHFVFVPVDEFNQPGQCTITQDGQLWTLNEKKLLATCFLHPGAAVRMPKPLAAHYGTAIMGLVSSGEVDDVWDIINEEGLIELTLLATGKDLQLFFTEPHLIERDTRLHLWSTGKLSEKAFAVLMESNESETHALPPYVAAQLQQSSDALLDGVWTKDSKISSARRRELYEAVLKRLKLSEALQELAEEHMTPFHVVKENLLHSKQIQGVPDMAINYRFEDTDGLVPDEAKPGRCFIDRFGCFWFVPAVKDDVCYPGVESAKPAKPVEFGYVKPGEAVELRGGHVVYGVHQNVQLFLVCDTKAPRFMFSSNTPEKILAALDRAAKHYADLGLLYPPYTMNPQAFQNVKDSLPRATKGRAYNDLTTDEQALLDGVESKDDDASIAASNWHPNPRVMKLSEESKAQAASVFSHAEVFKSDDALMNRFFSDEAIKQASEGLPLSELRLKNLMGALERVRNPMMSMTVKDGEVRIERIPNDPFDEQLIKLASPFLFPMSPSPELDEEVSVMLDSEKDIPSADREAQDERWRRLIDREFKQLANMFRGWSISKGDVEFVRGLYAYLGTVIHEGTLHESERFFEAEVFRFPYPHKK